MHVGQFGGGRDEKEELRLFFFVKWAHKYYIYTMYIYTSRGGKIALKFPEFSKYGLGMV